MANATQVSNVIEAPKAAKPYSSNKDWDKIGNEIKADQEAEKPEGDAALNGLFK